MQMLRGQVKIPRRSLQIFMTEQQLDDPQVGAGFQQMGGPTVAKGIVVLLMICIPQKSAIPYIHTSELK